MGWGVIGDRVNGGRKDEKWSRAVENVQHDGESLPQSDHWGVKAARHLEEVL